MLALVAVLLVAPLSHAPAVALIPSAPEPTETAAPVEQVIEATQDEGTDQRIGERIRGIYAELPAFQDVSVDVNEGVVSLSGTVADPDAIDRAANIAGRVSGVVTVENSLERDLSVESNLSILGKMSEIVASFLELLPLLTVALVAAIAIGALGYLIAFPAPLWNKIAPNAFLGELIRSAIRFVFVVGGIVVALDMLGAGALMGAVLGGAGVIGIALGFAMRDTIENYVASLMLSLRQPFRANDHVLIDDKEGRVIRLTSRATVLMTLDGNHLRIPNGQVFKAVILNYTRNPQRRFEFELGIDADDDPRAAMALGREVLQGLAFVLDDPEPAARIQNVGDSNIVILFLGWIDQTEADWFKSRSLAIAAVKEALEDAGFALPEPIYRLRFDSRTGPLPIGQTASVTETTPRKTSKVATQPEIPARRENDVRPESEIAAMVEEERRGDGEQAEDLLDAKRPVE
ncbi:mechanosensitive ion channel family protein [Altererythrobacter arenosus]|uniref:Small-conductance mechanosensitive channel n=1 Tax=Altererythrobacter arenosus TaxID=3032592 RepID=A0ABY8FW28_9SPHN|nr:mechanosensitive ion channel family protein [Altererythrobacter sp. CAU 1644]WFL79037.1 mechanosensitive ion channel family protein [Altererythrobacter sp. CAU 1644]